MANFETKTIKEIYDGIIAKYTTLRSKYEDDSPLLEKAAVRSLSYAFSGIAGGLWQLSVWVYKQCFPQTADLPALKFWGNLIGVNYKDGVAANLVISLADVSATYLSSGTVYKDLTSGLIFKTISQVNAVGGAISATVQCTTPGTAGNISAGTTLTIANPIDGIPSMATVSSVSIQGTADEALEDYRKRVLFKFRNKNQCGSPLDYYSWATEVSGIVDALVYILASGVITIYLVATGSSNKRSPSGSLTPNPFPSWVDGNFTELTGEGQMLAVAKAIEGSEDGVHDRRPAKAKVELRLPVYTEFKVEILGLTDASYKNAIKEAIVSYLDSKRPNIVVLGYDVSNAKVNKEKLSAACSAVIDNATFTSFALKNSSGTSINEATLGIGCLAYLSELTINGDSVAINEGE